MPSSLDAPHHAPGPQRYSVDRLVFAQDNVPRALLFIEIMRERVFPPLPVTFATPSTLRIRSASFCSSAGPRMAAPALNGRYGTCAPRSPRLPRRVRARPIVDGVLKRGDTDDLGKAGAYAGDRLQAKIGLPRGFGPTPDRWRAGCPRQNHCEIGDSKLRGPWRGSHAARLPSFLYEPIDQKLFDWHLKVPSARPGQC
jgi:hypothetical protein